MSTKIEMHLERTMNWIFSFYILMFIIYENRPQSGHFFLSYKKENMILKEGMKDILNV